MCYLDKSRAILSNLTIGTVQVRSKEQLLVSLVCSDARGRMPTKGPNRILIVFLLSLLS